MGFISDPVAVSAAGWQEEKGLRAEMEDGFVFIDQFMNRKAAFFAVYDGHGGQDAMQYCVDYVHQNLYVELSEGKAKGPTVSTRMVSNQSEAKLLPAKKCSDEPLGCTQKAVADALIYAFKMTDINLIDIGIQAGATACCCLLINQLDDSAEKKERQMLYTAHLGDARAVICRGGVAQRLTNPSDHKATCPEEKDRVHKNGGTVVHERVNAMLAIARAFGDFQLKTPFLAKDVVSDEPDVTVIDIEPDDCFVILACDGVWDVMTDQEAVNLLMETMQEMRLMGLGPKFKQKAEVCSRILVEEGLARGSTDNITAQVVFF